MSSLRLHFSLPSEVLLCNFSTLTSRFIMKRSVDRTIYDAISPGIVKNIFSGFMGRHRMVHEIDVREKINFSFFLRCSVGFWTWNVYKTKLMMKKRDDDHVRCCFNVWHAIIYGTNLYLEHFFSSYALPQHYFMSHSLWQFNIIFIKSHMIWSLS